MLKIVVVLGLLAIVSAQQACNASGPGRPWSAQCQDQTKPYCRNVAAPGSPVSSACVECFDHCDCGKSQYCSTDPAKGLGTCQDWVPTCDAAGCQCRLLTAAQLRDPSFPDSFKCGVVYSYTLGATTQYVADVVGACIEGTCSMCAYGGSVGSLGYCAPTDGTQGLKACTYGGTFQGASTYFWTPSMYPLGGVENTWWAIFFVFFIISIGIRIGFCCMEMRKK